MTGDQLIKKAVSCRIRGAEVTVEHDGTGYVVEVVAESFAARRRADREADVYSALQYLPLGLVSRIVRIDTRAE